MAIFKIVKSGTRHKGKLKRLTNYLLKESIEIKAFNTTLLSNNLDDLQKEMLFYKNLTTSEIECKHFVLSFKKNECDEMLQKQVLNDFLQMNEYFKNRFGFTVKHKNDNTTHYHIVSTHVSKDLKLENISNQIFYKFKTDLNTVLKSYNLETDLKKLKDNTSNRAFYTFNKNTESMLNTDKLNDSIHLNIAKTLIEIFNDKTIIELQQFIDKCKENNILVNISDTRKYVTYTYLNTDIKKNKIRCKRLNNMITSDKYNFGKEGIYGLLEKNRRNSYQQKREIDRGIESNLQDSYTSEFIDNLRNINTSRNDNYNANDVRKRERTDEIDKFIEESKYRARERNKELNETNKRIRKESDSKGRHNQSERERLENDKIRDILNQFSEEYEREEKRRAENERRKADEERRRAEDERRKLEKQRGNFEKQLENIQKPLGYIQKQDRLSNLSNKASTDTRKEKRGFDFDL